MQRLSSTILSTGFRFRVHLAVATHQELREWRLKNISSFVSDAMMAVEWNDSGDGDSNEIKKIEACL